MELEVERVVDGDSEDLLIEPLLITHLEDTEGTDRHQTAGEGRDGHHDQHIEGVIIVGQGPRDETIVARVIDRTIEEAVETEETSLLVQLVLVPAPARDLDHRIQLIWGIWSDRKIVPWIGNQLNASERYEAT